MGFLSMLIRIGGDSSGFVSEVRRANQSVDTLGDRLARSARRFVTVAAIMGAIRSITDYASKIKDAEDRLDVAAESAQQFHEATKRGGTDLNVVAVAMEKTGRAMEEILTGGDQADKMTESFKKFGITLEDIRNKTREEIFRDMLDQMASSTMGVDKHTAAFNLLGKGYGKLIPAAKELQEIMANGGAVPMSGAEVDFWDKFGDDVGAAMDSAKGLAGKFGIGLVSSAKLLAGLFTGQDMDTIDQLMGVKDEGSQELRRKILLAETQAIIRAAEEEKKRADANQQKEIAAKAHMAVMDRVNDLEREALEIEEKAREKGLTKLERKNELLKRQAELQLHLKNQPAEVTSPEMMEFNAKAKKELAGINLELATMRAEDRMQMPQMQGSARTGLFIGHRNDPMVNIGREQLNVLRRIDKNTSNANRGTDVNAIFGG
jgi:hypothetical protein